jgi:hypothetical protein
VGPQAQNGFDVNFGDGYDLRNPGTPARKIPEKRKKMSRE